MIVAKVTIYDDETGQIFDENKIIQGRLECNPELFGDDKNYIRIETYDFHFKFQRAHMEGIK